MVSGSRGRRIVQCKGPKAVTRRAQKTIACHLEQHTPRAPSLISTAASDNSSGSKEETWGLCSRRVGRLSKL